MSDINKALLCTKLNDKRTELKKLVRELSHLSFAAIDKHDMIVESIIFVSKTIGRLEHMLNINQD